MSSVFPSSFFFFIHIITSRKLHSPSFLVLSPSTTMHSPGEISEKRGVHSVNIREVDVAASLDSDKPLDPSTAARIRYHYRRPS